MQKKKIPLFLGGLLCISGVFVVAALPLWHWVTLLLDGGSAWWFWPLWLLLSLSISLSYFLPWGPARKFFHRLGEGWMWAGIYLALAFWAQALLLLLFKQIWGSLSREDMVLAGWIALAVFGAIYLFGVLNARVFRSKTYEIPAPVQKQVRLLLLSDLHLGYFTTNAMLQRIVDKAEKAAPDIILIAGDLFDMDFAELRGREEKQRLLCSLTQLAPTYACLGNHDNLFPEEERLHWLRQCGVLVLQDTFVEKKGLVIYGRRDKVDPLRQKHVVLPVTCQDKPLLILDHQPQTYKQNWAEGAFLVLSGHTHGGQTFPGNFLQQLIFSAPIYGIRQQGEQYLLVTSGAGYWGPPLRLWVNNEVVSLTLVPKE